MGCHDCDGNMGCHDISTGFWRPNFKVEMSLCLLFVEDVSIVVEGRGSTAKRGTETLLQPIYIGRKYPHIYTLSISTGNQSAEA